MPVFVGSREIVNLGEITLGSQDVQAIYFGSQLIWPTGPVAPDGGYRMLEDGCRRALELVGDLRLLESGQPMSSTTPEAQSVLDRMCGLSAQEELAIIAAVTSLVTSGLWTKIVNIWGFGLNDADYKTPWLDETVARQTGALVTTALEPSHTATGVQFVSDRYFRTENNIPTFFDLVASGVFVYLNQWLGADRVAPTDLYGAEDAIGNGYINRWGGSTFTGYDLIMGTNGPFPRPLDPQPNGTARWGEDVSGGATDGAVIGGWSEGDTDTVLLRFDIPRGAARTFTGMPNLPLQITGSNQNNVGGISPNFAPVELSLLVMVRGATFVEAEVSTLRAIMLQFARDIGLPDVPAT